MGTGGVCDPHTWPAHMEEGEKLPILLYEEEKSTGYKEYKLYKRRWYILLVFSTNVLNLTMISGMWGPMARSANIAFGWSDGSVAMLSSWGSTSTLFASIGAIWLVEKKGLRTLTLVGSVLVCVGGVFRSITSTSPAVFYTTNIGQFFNGMSNTVIYCGTPVLSASWFPDGQRTTASTIAWTMVSVGHLIGPSLISLLINIEDHLEHALLNNDQNKTALSYLGCAMDNCSTESIANTSTKTLHLDQRTNDVADNQRDIIMMLVYAQLGCSLLLFLVALIYFPAKPPTPPSTSAALERAGIGKAWVELVRLPQFWLVCVAYCITIAPFFIWRTVLALVMMDLGFSQDESNTIEWRTGVATIVTVLIVGRITDLYNRKMKIVVILMLIIGSLGIVMLILHNLQLVPYSTISMYVLMYIIQSSFSSAAPSLFELCAEASFPIGEGVTVGVVGIISGLVGFLYMTVFWVPSTTTLLPNAVLLGGCCVSIIAISLFKDELKRLDVDQNILQKVVSIK